MRLVDDWRFLLTRSHSMWGFYLTGLFLILPDLIYVVAGIDTNPRVWWLLAAAAWVYGMAGRLIDQQDEDGTGPLTPLGTIALMALIMFLTMGMGKVPEGEPEGIEVTDGAPPSEAEWASVAVPLVAKWEGLRTHAYLDTIAEPDVWTVCYGETRNVGPNDSYTPEQCAAKLRARLLEYRAGWHDHLTPITLNHRLTPERDAAFTSFSYNVGIAGAGGSTATRRLNAGDLRGSCEALTWWNKAGQRVIRGLVNRRADEKRLCMVGVR
ncbi:lysozyme [uncultured Mameliella sp.]|mgnify:CR=1 FL=1|uniref:lysozyme n=1 Tax=uncultured Mameliella sp. TaxID=1447087 RepID=UPI00261EB826|nr:lysozyme [uncultured Mameliella sp.]